MNINKYIESGILELYLTGALSDSESAEVKANIEIYPELKRELDSIEKILLNTGAAIGGSLPNDLFDKIESKIDSQDTGSNLSNKAGNTNANMGKLLGAIGIVGFIFGIYSYTKMIQKEALIHQINNDNIELKIALTDCEDRLNTQEVLFAARSSATKSIVLSGQNISPASFAIVHWNQNNNSVVVDASGLPTPPSGKEYQLWSLKFNPLTPTDAGVLSNFEGNPSMLFEAKDVQLAEGFAITLEPEGGSENPNLDQLYVLGTI